MAKSKKKSLEKDAESKKGFAGLIVELEQMKKDGLLENLSLNARTALVKKFRQANNRFMRLFLRRRAAKFAAQLNKAYRTYVSSTFVENNKGLRGWRVDKMKPALRLRFKEAIQQNLLLVQTQTPQRMMSLESRFLDWIQISSNKAAKQERLRTALKITDTIKKTDKHFKFILEDQTRKMLSSFDYAVAQEYEAIGFFWKTRRDNKVVGKPGGKNPNPTPQHGDHYHRQDKFYFYRGSWAIKQNKINTKHKDFEWADFEDGLPGMPIGCRCYMYNIYELNDVPKKLLKNLEEIS